MIGQDGKRYGPADLATLQLWQSQGRVHADTWLEDESTGLRQPARDVLTFDRPPQTPPGFTPPPDTASPYPRISEYAPATGNNGQTLLVVGWVCAVVSLCFCPLVFGAAAIVLGVLAKQKGQKNAVALIVCAALFMVFGIVVGFLLVANNPDFQKIFG